MDSKLNALLGKWRIVESDWDDEYLHDGGPAHIQIGVANIGLLAFGGISSELDYKICDRDGSFAIDFTLQGWDAGEKITGSGWAKLDEDGRMRLHVSVHNGDEAEMIAVRAPNKKPRRSRAR